MDDLRDFYDTNINGVALSTEVLQKAYNFENPQRRLGFTKNRLYMSSAVFVFRKKSILTNTFNEQLLRLKEFGLLEFWEQNRIEAHNSKVKMKKTQPTKLGLYNILAAFQICGVLYLISGVVFILEIISVRFSRIKSVLDFWTYWFWTACVATQYEINVRTINWNIKCSCIVNKLFMSKQTNE